jgi:hypothetical protein
MSTPTLFGGCSYVVGHGKKGKTPFKIFCNKMVEPMQQFCPKHLEVMADESKEPERRALARRQKKEHAAAELEALALSPLRADNPDFDKPKTYTEAE